jgi:hypothetical protein
VYRLDDQASFPVRGRTFSCLLLLGESCDSSVSIALGYGLDDWGLGFDFQWGWKFFSSPPSPEWSWVPPILLSSGYQGSFPGGKLAWAWSWPLTSSTGISSWGGGHYVLVSKAAGAWNFPSNLGPGLSFTSIPLYDFMSYYWYVGETCFYSMERILLHRSDVRTVRQAQT